MMITSPKRAVATAAPTGFGKCFAPWTPILLFNGMVCPLNEIVEGDWLMGPDSKPRQVTEIHQGVDQMYRITPTKGISHEVNSRHILTIKQTPEAAGKKHKLLEISIEQYLDSSFTFKHRAKLYRTGVNFKEDGPELFSPYFLGLWLGDGTSLHPHITTADKQIVEYLQHFASDCGLVLAPDYSKKCPTYKLRGLRQGNRYRRNPLTSWLRALRVHGSKHVPIEYRVGTRRERLALLAGYLDADGSLSGDCVFDAVTIDKYLAETITHVARSLGFAAYCSLCEKSCQTGVSGYYYRISISGNTDEIPTLLPHKKAKPRRQIKDQCVTGFSVAPIGEGPFIGLTVEGPDSLFLLGDFTVVHNSPTYVAAAILSKLPTCIVTNSRGLQDQLMADFSSIGLVDIRGRRNYQCDMKEDMTCEEGHAARCPWKGTVGCPSSQAEMRAAVAPLVVTNYDKWTSSRKFGQGMSHFQQVIFDEGHDAPEALSRAMQVVLHHKEIEDNLKLDFPTADADEFWTWKPWAAEARALAEVAQIAALARLQGVSNPKTSWVRHYTHMRNLSRRLATIATANDREWVVEEIKDGFQFDPVRPGRYAESTLLLRIPKIIVVSATLRPKTMFMMGLGKDNFDFKEFDSDFDRKRCPIYYIPTMRVDSRNPDLRMLFVRLDQIAAKRRDRKGIIQTVSYQRQEDVRSASRFYDSMYLNPKGDAPTEMIESYRQGPAGSILVSPSVGTGYDFPGSQCEWNFLCKIPFEPPSVILRAREAQDPEYRAYKAMQKMVQIFGRGMRSKEDMCENFIADDHCEWYLPRYGHLAPRSFHAFYRTVTVLPQPPEKLKW